MHIGQIGEHGLKEIYKRGLLDGKMSCKIDFCKLCVMGKQSKVSYSEALHSFEAIQEGSSENGLAIVSNEQEVKAGQKDMVAYALLVGTDDPSNF
ncbi:unnamed protein product [Arabis nemorensis]|uniref:GAG-pre-integrase domain-containing protein n=1 Tax=Arabis nemorensis TaxID=586526 RepID=A0A565AYK5_9BRAS|nr:unnamed protein product [Arabis nemorensis]